MTTLLQHAKSELRAAGHFDDGDLGVRVTALIETLMAYGPFDASTFAVFNRVGYHLPLTPLTGEDDEWEIPTGTSGQLMINKRCTQVFKDDEMAWDIRKGRTPITFPYTP